jgi:hypothetical protein
MILHKGSFKKGYVLSGFWTYLVLKYTGKSEGYTIADFWVYFILIALYISINGTQIQHNDLVTSKIVSYQKKKES